MSDSSLNRLLTSRIVLRVASPVLALAFDGQSGTSVTPRVVVDPESYANMIRRGALSSSMPWMPKS